jgi:hypothetical protein
MKSQPSRRRGVRRDTLSKVYVSFPET